MDSVGFHACGRLGYVELASYVRHLGQTLIEAAHAAPDLTTWQGTMFDALATVGFDVAFMKAVPPHCAFVSRGFDAEMLKRMRARWPTYARELAPLTLASQREGVAIDGDVFGARRERLAYFQELVRPQGGTSSLYAHLALGAHEIGGLMLGRTGPGFSGGDINIVRGLLAPLSVGLAAVMQHESLHQAHGRCAIAAVTPREGEVLRLLQLGYTNPEIACALGTSPNTVRNQVASLLAKVGATTRAELVGLTVRS
jgi:DNA-binding CsgD family transcriptional regulator